MGVTAHMTKPANKDSDIAVRDKRNLIQDIRGIVQDIEQAYHEDYETWRQWQSAIDEVNSSLSNSNVKKFEQLDNRPVAYATHAMRTDKLNDHLAYEYQWDRDGRLSRVDVGECVHTCEDFLANL